ncbi:MAG: cyanophycin synthetase [Thermoguttaceae bacterium]
MEFRKVLALRGPNIWTNAPVLEVWVDLGGLDRPSTEFPGFSERLMAWLPTMIEHRCSIGQRGGFFQRLRDGTYPGHILEHVTLELQSLAGVEVGFGRARETSQPGVYRVVVKYHEETLARECLAAARELILAAIADRPVDLKAEIDRLRELAHEVCLGPSTKAIVAAALARGIPVRRLNSCSLVQLGYGARQRRIQAAETDRTGAIAEQIAQDKELTRLLLRSVGVPVPEGRPVVDADDAWAAACEIGLPVVVKPRDGNQGRGVATNLSTQEQVRAAYQAALLESKQVIVERFASGHDYRLLCVGGKIVAAARREPAQVAGDGLHTVKELIDLTNLDPRRGEHHATVLSKIKLDAVALGVLADQGLTPDSVPPPGTVVLIRRNGNLSTGGTAIDVTERVHPQVAARAVEAAQVIGLDVAGVDVVAADISAPLEEQGGVIVEVNAAPGLRMHLEPSVGISRPVGEVIIGTLFPEGQDGRIPIAAVSGTNGKTTTARFLAHILRGAGLRVGMTCTDGIYIDGRRIDSGDCSGPKSAAAVLMNPAVEAAVFETARGGILREGLAFDRCDVAVVTNIGQGDHLGLNEVHTAEDLAKVKRCIVDVVPPSGTAVLNANDPLVVAMEPYCAGKICYFALDGNHPVIVRHRHAGGQALFVRDNTVLLAEGPSEQALLPLERVPLTRGGRVGFHVENTLAAVAAALALAVPPDVIRARAESFAADMEKVPARFNVLEIHGATVIVDYGHNADALAALVQAMEAFPHQRRVCLYTTAGDRRDADIIRQGELLGAAFDRVILYEDHYLRGRPEGEIIALIRRGVQSGSRTREIEEIRGADAAVELALRTAQPGDLVLVQADTVDETIQCIRRYLESVVEPAIDETPSEAERQAAVAKVEEAKRKPATTETVATGVVAASPSVAKV